VARFLVDHWATITDPRTPSSALTDLSGIGPVRQETLRDTGSCA
jgi:predicted flap endonuclease-1-like 5' DNA nuclease